MNNTSSTRCGCNRNSCIMRHDELFQLHVAIQKVLGMLELSFIASIKCRKSIDQFETYLDKNYPIFSYHMFNAKRKFEYTVKMPNDLDTCWITAICVLPDVQVLVACWGNKKVQQLNQQY